MNATKNRTYKIGDLVTIRDGFVPRGCTGTPATKGVVVSSDHEVYVAAWSTTKKFHPADLTPRKGELTKDEQEAIAEALALEGE